MSARAVVFAYGDVGVRCLKALLSARIEVPLVITHRDDPNAPPWHASVAAAAADYGLTVAAPETPNTAQFALALAQLRPDFLFSFYYRSLLDDALLRIPRLGALNMHGSLLPKYRGRAPLNWAILNGERETGATLHHMVSRADAGDIVDQLAVPILQDDDAREVMTKVTTAAEIVLTRSLPGLLDGTAPRTRQRIDEGSYFGRRHPEHGRIDWSRSAAQVHNLVRAVAPPFPGAFTEIEGRRWWIHRTRVAPGNSSVPIRVRLFAADGACQIACADGGVLRLLAAATDAGPLDLSCTARELQARSITLS